MADTLESPRYPASGENAVVPTQPHRLCIIANPGAGDHAPETLRAPVARCTADIELRILTRSQTIADETRRAVDEGFGTIVAAGGDGTISAVAGALAGKGRRFGILPLGTFNFMARSLGLPLDPDAALAVILGGRTQDLAVGEINGRIFLNNASIGIYPAILQQREAVYKRWGRSRLAAYWSVLLTLAGFRRPQTLRVTVDGTPHRVRTPLAFIASSAYQLEQFALPGADCIRSGNFAVLLAPDVGRWGLLRFAVLLLGRRIDREKDFKPYCGRDIVIEAKGRRLIARDGERERMRGPFRFRRREAALQVLVPKDAGAE